MLAGTAYIVTVVFALVIGVFAALRQYTIADNIITGFSFITFSLPVFLLALILVQVFAVEARKAGLWKRAKRAYPRSPSAACVTRVGTVPPMRSSAI